MPGGQRTLAQRSLDVVAVSQHRFRTTSPSRIEVVLQQDRSTTGHFFATRGIGAIRVLHERRDHRFDVPPSVDPMLRCGHQIRLTRAEVERFVRLTDIEPSGIRTLDDLNDYVVRCKAHYWGDSRDTRFLHWLIERERERCVRAA